MVANINIGILGHVDSGKTTLAKSLSTIASTAAFDKDPQSKKRGITIDLGFSAYTFEKHFSKNCPSLQLTFVDCPGHSSLIKTVIFGSQIIDMVLLVIDAQKGIQIQTSECIIIGEILNLKLLVVVNKIDLMNEIELNALKKTLAKTFGKTAYGSGVPIYFVSAINNTNLDTLRDYITSEIHIPIRNLEKPLIIYIDHCFRIKGKGTICTGTVVQGKISLKDEIEFPAINQKHRVKSLQTFRKPIENAQEGDRIGICFSNLNAKLLERGLIGDPGYLKYIYSACIHLHPIKYFKFPIKSNEKYHITMGNDTVMACITLFQSVSDTQDFDISKEYEYVETIDLLTTPLNSNFALLEFEKPILALNRMKVIATKLDLDANTSKQCRFAFWGSIEWMSQSKNYRVENFTHFKIFKHKEKFGNIYRLNGADKAIVKNLFNKNNRESFIGQTVELTTGEKGFIQNKFGQNCKVEVYFPNGLNKNTLNILNSKQKNDLKVKLKYRLNIFDKALYREKNLSY